AVSLGLSSIIVIIFFSNDSMSSVALQLFTASLNYTLLAIPFFILASSFMTTGGVARRIIRFSIACVGHLPGGLAIAGVFACMLFAALSGSSPATVVAIGSIVIAGMRQVGYTKEFAAGVICNAGTLGILIPPSIMLVFMGAILQVSVGDMFKAAFLPGLLLGAVYILYIVGVGVLTPHRAPVPNRAEIAKLADNGAPLWIEVIQNLLGPLFLIVAVLGSIMVGLATPTEAAGIGAAGAMMLALMTRKLNFSVLREVVRDTSKTTAMVIFVMIGAACFSAVFKRLGGDDMIEELFIGTGFGPYGLLILMMGLIFVMGFFLEWIEISFIVMPLFAPIVATLDFGFEATGLELLVWFAILSAVNMQTSFITPPFGYALFYLRGVAPEGVDIKLIYQSSIPFVILQLICLTILVVFPDIVLWLTRL
ncbi:MAG: TRAP transporter large permease subunit, partial [Dinoroseobacter sp.]|nr:TRAP transporter large permease subunit [Dinoroseobacter sp.]